MLWAIAYGSMIKCGGTGQGIDSPNPLRYETGSKHAEARPREIQVKKGPSLMAVIARYIVIRDGVELDKVFTDKKEAEAYDHMLDAAQQLAALIKEGGAGIDIDAPILDAVCIHLAKNAPDVTAILRTVKPFKPSVKATGTDQTTPDAPTVGKKKVPEPKIKPRTKAN